MFTGNTRWVLRLGILAVGILAVWVLVAAQADQPVAALVKYDSPEQESLDVRYARAHLKLAQLDLRRFLAVRKNFPGLLPSSAAEQLKRHVAIDEEQLKQALKGPDGDLHQIYLRSAEMAVELAKADLKRKQRANEQFPSESQALELARAHAVVEVAKLHAEITSTKESSSDMMYLQWQIELLRNRVLELELQVSHGLTQP